MAQKWTNKINSKMLLNIVFESFSIFFPSGKNIFSSRILISGEQIRQILEPWQEWSMINGALYSHSQNSRSQKVRLQEKLIHYTAIRFTRWLSQIDHMSTRYFSHDIFQTRVLQMVIFKIFKRDWCLKALVFKTDVCKSSIVFFIKIC